MPQYRDDCSSYTRMSDEILKKILKELVEIRESIARFDEFILELSPSEAKKEIKDLKK